MTASVIIPVFNGERYLGEAIESVVRQTVRPSEIIVVDDGSTDSSPQIAKGFEGVTLVRQENSGTSAARNRGIRESSGEFLAFLDQDDLWERDKLALQLDTLSDRPDLGVCFGFVRQFVSPDIAGTQADRFDIPDLPQEGYSPSAMLARRSAFLEIGLFNERLSQAEWIEWLLRLNESDVGVTMLNDVVCRRRVHQSNKGVVRRDLRREYLRALKESIERRR